MATAEQELTIEEREALGDMLRRQAAEREAFVARIQQQGKQVREEFQELVQQMDVDLGWELIGDMLAGGFEQRQGALNPLTAGRVTLQPVQIYRGNLTAVDVRGALETARERAAVGTTPVALVCVRGKALAPGQARPRAQEWFERMVAVVDLSEILPQGRRR